MRNRILFSTLLGIPEDSPLCKEPYPSGTSHTPYCFLEEGHSLEYIQIGNGRDKRRSLILFVGPGELAVNCHPKYGYLQTLDEAKVGAMSQEDVMKLLRISPEMHSLPGIT